jgi:hypothetical protein
MDEEDMEEDMEGAPGVNFIPWRRGDQASRKADREDRREKTKVPAHLAVNGDKSGGGSSPRSLSRNAGIRRRVGCQLPDAILHGKRSFGLIAGPFSASRRLNLSSEASGLASAGVCGRRLANRVKTRL